MAETSVITEEMRNLLNVEFGPEVYEIEKGMLKKFVQAIDDPNPLWQKVAPPTFVAALRLDELTQKIWTVKCPLSRFLNGGNEIEYYQPIKVGDVISVTGKLVDLREREGRLGKMVFMTVELTYKNQQGEIVAKGRNTLIRY